MKYALLGALAGLALLSATTAQAEVKPNALFSDGAVLQQGIRLPVFGTADEGEKVTVTFAGQTQTTHATGGRWQVAFKPVKMQATPLTMTIAGPGNTVMVKNLLVGEVYVCSGQSNMGFNLGSAATGPQAIANSTDPQLRLFTVPNVTASTPQQTEGGQWQEAG
ncbi:MAG: sialate O-acetylesterase, partial [Armatimonadota bacterium]|nr:sialate O-acetylesterase [Armatimonadota bacterium]